MKELEGRTAKELTHDRVARLLELEALGKIVFKAAHETAYARMNAGHKIPGFKLGAKRAERVWKDGAEEAAIDAFGDAAYTTPELLSPAQLEALPKGKSFAAQWAFKPDAGLTVVKGEDTRADVSTKSMFTPRKKGK